MEQLFNAIEIEHNNDIKDIMLLALYTGMRKSEMLALLWEDIDFERGFIFIRQPKGGVNQKIPLNIHAEKILRKRKQEQAFGYVFPGRDGKKRDQFAFSKGLSQVRDRAGLPRDFRPLHGLRHVYASMLASSGEVDMYTLQKLLTHKSPQMTQRYAHLRDDALKKASDLAGEIIQKAIKETLHGASEE
jgi:integrase